VAVTAASIRTVLIGRIEDIVPTTRDAVKFTRYPQAGCVDYEDVVVPNSRVFEVQIGETEEVGPHNGSSIDLMTRFRVIVLYKPQADIDDLEQMVSEDRNLVRNELRREVAGETSLILDGQQPKVERGRDYWRLEVVGRAQHAEAEWSAT
jgi:hypothetical protein